MAGPALTDVETEKLRLTLIVAMPPLYYLSVRIWWGLKRFVLWIVSKFRRRPAEDQAR